MNPFSADKLARFPERIAEWMRTGRTSGPIVVDFDLTNRCPHNCPACPGEWRSDPDSVWETAEAMSILRQFRDMGTLAVSFTGGGDPLAHPDCIEIFEYVAGLGFSVGVVTNGAVLKKGWADRLAFVCKWIRVSLDAATPETFARVHGVPEAHFQTILDNIKELASVPERQAITGVGFLTSESSKEEIVRAAGLVKATGADYIQYRPFNYDRYDARPKIKYARVCHETEAFKVLASYPKYDLMDNPDWQKPYTKCRFPWFDAVIQANGDMALCCDTKIKVILGNVKRERPADIWKRDKPDVNVSKCPPFCRGNVHNLYLDKIASEVTDEEFL